MFKPKFSQSPRLCGEAVKGIFLSVIFENTVWGWLWALWQIENKTFVGTNRTTVALHYTYEVVIPYIRLNPDPHRCPHEGSPRIQNIVALAAGYMAITIFPYQLQN
ncbi:unnamed protein product [Aspergillus oryzae RIB40]|uniref:DNA, SC102 n=1 Tax=Aspergillus oryzae (strain ATCC 42149 / RIB 40) TaxID=510516 RepID=Q2UAT0_ASPOR|nr:unnamed protein product [Aspergillus oryzae RIB40]BAE61335.1 unnamed protein product [Aspergillus oryzae RIB40]